MAITVQLIRAEQAMSILLHLCPVSGWPVTRIDRPDHDTRAMTAYKPKPYKVFSNSVSCSIRSNIHVRDKKMSEQCWKLEHSM